MLYSTMALWKSGLRVRAPCSSEAVVEVFLSCSFFLLPLPKRLERDLLALLLEDFSESLDPRLTVSATSAAGTTFLCGSAVVEDALDTPEGERCRFLNR